MRSTCFIILIFFAGASTAGRLDNATVSSVVVDSNGIARVTLDGGTEVDPPPGCTVNSSKFTYDLNGLSGSAWHSMILTAQATQKNVHIIGKNTCLALNGALYEEAGTIYTLSQ